MQILNYMIEFFPLVCTLESGFILALITKDSSGDRLWLRVGKAGCRARFTRIKIEISSGSRELKQSFQESRKIQHLIVAHIVLQN